MLRKDSWLPGKTVVFPGNQLYSSAVHVNVPEIICLTTITDLCDDTVAWSAVHGFQIQVEDRWM